LVPLIRRAARHLLPKLREKAIARFCADLEVRRVGSNPDRGLVALGGGFGYPICARNSPTDGIEVNKFRFSWAALSLLAPVLIFSAICFGPAGCSGGGGSTPTPVPTAAEVQVGFVTSVTSSVTGFSASNLQNFFFNVTGVRMNPQPNATHTASPSETSGKWVEIPVPTATSTGTVPGDVPIDVLAGQSQLQVFNTGGVKTGKYFSIEVVLDTTQPGYVVPVCAGGNLEGCVRYPIQLQNATNTLTYVRSTELQTTQHETVQLPIMLSASVVSTPSGPGQPYVVSLTASDAPNEAAAYVGTVTGTVKGAKSASSSSSHVRVSASLAGTNTVVASSDAFQGSFTMFLPAAISGTLYDFVASGGSATYAVQRGVDGTGAPLFPDAAQMPATVDFQVKSGQTIGGFAGQITDKCTQQPVSGATLQILEPLADGTDCTTDPQDCVTVASATSDDNGNYPLPGTTLNPPPFAHVPIGSPTATYVIEISATGYDTQFTTGTAGQSASTGGKTAAGHCPAAMPTNPSGSCNFPLTTAYLTGSVSLTAAQPPGAKTTVQVFAENPGTNTIVGMLPTPLTLFGGQTSLGFTLNVPSATSSFDLVASAEDLYQGGPDPYPGHTIIVQQGVSGPGTKCTSNSFSFSQSMDCVGHGSIVGTVANNPDSSTSVLLSKNGVAITEASVVLASPAATASAGYSFCIPPDDSYSVQRLENGTPTSTATTVGAMATPMATNSPCPSTCFSSSGGGCPGICSNTAGPNL
jgi:hypothetical protein